MRASKSTRSPAPPLISPPAVRFSNRRLAREWKTITAMLRIYCREHHGGPWCAECVGLMGYIHLRLDHCRFGQDKPTCAKCPVHCYQRDRREQVKAVMRFAGPRMLWRHPWLSLCHLLDGRFRRPAPAVSVGDQDKSHSKRLWICKT
jgi:hypothetical protein